MRRGHARRCGATSIARAFIVSAELERGQRFINRQRR